MSTRRAGDGYPFGFVANTPHESTSCASANAGARDALGGGERKPPETRPKLSLTRRQDVDSGGAFGGRRAPGSDVALGESGPVAVRRAAPAGAPLPPYVYQGPDGPVEIVAGGAAAADLATGDDVPGARWRPASGPACVPVGWGDVAKVGALVLAVLAAAVGGAYLWLTQVAGVGR